MESYYVIARTKDGEALSSLKAVWLWHLMPLALDEAEHAKECLESRPSEYTYEIVPVSQVKLPPGHKRI